MRRLLGVGLAVLILMGAGFQVHAQEAGSGYYDLGVFAYEDGDYGDAEVNFKKALAFDPENPTYHHYLGRTYLKVEQYENAKGYLETAWEKNPDLTGLNYDLAFLYYKMEDYGRASKRFLEIVEEEPSNVLAGYYGGICLYQEKRYQKAGELFVAAAEKSPSLKINGYYYAGICLYQTGNMKQAAEKFTYVKANTDSPDVRNNADKWLATIKKKKEKKPYQLDFTVQYVYDDNVPIEPTGQDALYSKEADSGIFGYASGRYNVVNRSNFVLGAGVARSQIWYSDLTQFNMSDTNADVYTSYSTGSFLIGLNYLPRVYSVDGEDYLIQHQIRPAVYWQPSRRFMTRFGYAYFLKDYQQEVSRDGNLHDGYVDVYYNILKGRGFIFGGLGYESNSADVSEFDYNRSKIKAGLSMDLGWRVKLGLEGYFYQKRFPNLNPYYGVKREDDKYYGVVSLKRPVYRDWLSLSVEYNHITNNSNVDLFEYRRNTIGIGLDVNF